LYELKTAPPRFTAGMLVMTLPLQGSLDAADG
jgi:hypothetical protein